MPSTSTADGLLWPFADAEDDPAPEGFALPAGVPGLEELPFDVEEWASGLELEEEPAPEK
jgi:hypothetical protein